MQASLQRLEQDHVSLTASSTDSKAWKPEAVAASSPLQHASGDAAAGASSTTAKSDKPMLGFAIAATQPPREPLVNLYFDGAALKRLDMCAYVQGGLGVR